MRGRLEVWGGSLVLEGVRDFGSYKIPAMTLSSYKLALNTEYACI